MADNQDTAPPEQPDTAAMSDRQLAKAVLARQIRPRVGEVRRLAQAVVAKSEKKKPAKKRKKKKSVRKLPTIPGQKSR